MGFVLFSGILLLVAFIGLVLGVRVVVLGKNFWGRAVYSIIPGVGGGLSIIAGYAIIPGVGGKRCLYCWCWGKNFKRPYVQSGCLFAERFCAE